MVNDSLLVNSKLIFRNATLYVNKETYYVVGEYNAVQMMGMHVGEFH